MPSPSLPSDYEQRVYAGVLGKIIGVYLGRPFEGWRYERILRELGEVWYYVHDRLDKPLVVSDDDITGTFTFLRALEDFLEDSTAAGGKPNIERFTAERIGQAWLNYIIENRSILWWGGMGMSTEHTAFMRLKAGIPAPRSGSIALNGRTVAEQIGAQIFIDGWAMVAPGNPELAADLAKKAGSVSHDGEAVYAAQLVAAIESLAFVEHDLNRILNAALALIPNDSVIYRMAADLRQTYAAQQKKDWRQAFTGVMQAKYGYDRFGGNCHVVPNHGIVLLALLWGEDDFQKSLMIANTCGWDTDCNSANVGCILGIKNGLAGINAGPDWRTPVADRMLLPTADGGRCVSDAATETRHIARMGRKIAGEPAPPISDEDARRYHFSLPGSVQGWMSEESPGNSGLATIENAGSASADQKQSDKGLAINFRRLAPGRVARAAVTTFPGPDLFNRVGYAISASPSLYSGQTIRAELSLTHCRRLATEENAGPEAPIIARLYIQHYGEKDALVRISSPHLHLRSSPRQLQWRVPDTGGGPIAAVGVEIETSGAADGTVILHWLTWDGTPNVTLKRVMDSEMWHRAWVNGADSLRRRDPNDYFIVQNSGRGLISQGERQWTDYHAEGVFVPSLASAFGLAARVQGMTRYYALLLTGEPGHTVVRLVKRSHDEMVLAEKPLEWEFDREYRLELQIEGSHLEARVDGKPVLTANDEKAALRGGGIGLICQDGCIGVRDVSVRPIENSSQK